MTKTSFAAFYADNRGLVHKVAKKVHARLMAMGAAVEFRDVEQEASIVMMRAYDKFDPDLGFKFSTYFMKAAFYELNKFVSSYEKDRFVLGVFSMQAAVGEDGESIDMESSIDGGHARPDQVLECKQTFEHIKAELSPLANLMLNALIDPPEQMVAEWEAGRKLGKITFTEMNLTFIGEYFRRISNASANEVKFANSEIRSLGRLLNV